MKTYRNLCMWVMGVVLALASVGRAAPLDDRVPGSSLLYFGWAGADALAPQYANSNLKGVVDASTAGKFIEDMLPKLIAMAAQNDPNAPQEIAKLQSGLGIVWRHPTAVYFCPLDLTNFQQPIFRFGVLCDAGGDAKELAGLLTEALAGAPANDPNVPKVSQEGNFVLFTVGKPEKIADLKAGGTLNASAAYMKAMGQVKVNGPAAAAMYVDVRGVLNMVDDALTKGEGKIPPDAAAMARKVIDALGVKSLTQVAMQAGFDGMGWGEKAFVGINGPRSGLLTLLDQAPLANDVLASVPKDAAAFSAAELDFGKVFNEARTVIGKIDAGALQQFDQALDQGKNFLGFDINADFIQALGDQWVMYRAPLGDAGMSWAVVVKLRDADRFSKTLDALATLFNERSGAPFKVEKMKVGTSDASMISFLVYNVAWTVHNGSLYVSTMAGLPAAISQVDDKSPSIAESDLYKNVMKMMPPGIKPTALSYCNPARLYPELRTGLLQLFPLARNAGVDIPMDILPDPTAVAKFMTPGGSVAWSDADGVHGLESSAFPGADMVAGQGGGTGTVAVGALGAAILLPSLGRAREMSERTVDAANLRGIAMSSILWATDHKDVMPDNMGQLVLDEGMSPKLLVSKRIGTEPLEMTPELEAMGKSDFAKFAEMVDEHSDYVYVGKGTKNDTDPTIVVAYGKPTASIEDGINIAYADGHVDFVRWGNVEQAFAATVAYLAKNKLPALDLTAIRQFDARGGARMAPAGQLP